ncbi:universal stress protein [Pistricoccus aurantiacus]|uniref:Universal stress protein n=1 Tax=Pistricoccus aurantiacus TaxID=1883414 RepID=A0A5B8SRK3_9GAMM|nr:universal stress protein [Pistricoccus aurantiacus]QEA38901.1 universal stress protein [Pistricoccus aurantiacus]
MKMYPTKIMVAVDGSAASDRAITQAVELCDATRSELHLLLVGLISPWTHPDTLSERQYGRLKQENQRRLDQEVEKARAGGAKAVVAHLRMGRVDTEVVRLAEEIGVGLLVVGNRGRESLARVLLGHDSESIVRHAPCSVMVVR